ncbi:hypothetical protein ED312_02805 [Sinomicrobium pectinilyticum]|uniref:Uncharacterized protein n=1 Tax=Sinomicrobium pectinilyticum TaxID=1084421 RepID=A0A3N0F098_SINP1|nr:hypothetical protein [Sinomicrobium pectinilyticum]RNL93392.1 hypothetical protein ED312_02805 [Sinomicrobium pectinilyticum]
MKSEKKKPDDNTAKEDSNLNAKTLEKALRTLKSRLATNDIKYMKEIPGEYTTGIRSALGLGYNTLINRYHDPRKLTLKDILNTADITNTDYEIVLKIAIREAIRNHTKRDISIFLPNEGEITE